MDYLKKVKEIINDRKDYLINRSTLSQVLSGLVFQVDKVEKIANSKQDKLIVGDGMKINGNQVSLSNSDNLSPLLLMGA